MTVTTLSGRELNQDLGRAKRAANEGPIRIITDRGRPAHVLLSFFDECTNGLPAKCGPLVTCWPRRGGRR